MNTAFKKTSRVDTDYLLHKTPIGATCTIYQVKGDNRLKRRLWDLGFTKGTQITTLFSSPFGNPRAYLIRGSVIALRNEDAASIQLITSKVNVDYGLNT